MADIQRGVFQTLVPVFNRAPIALTIQFDGQQYTLEPGGDKIPEVTVPFAKNQNPIMGSADPNNPHVSGGRYLIVVAGDEGYGVAMTPEEWNEHLGQPQRIDAQAAFQEKYGNDPKAKLVTMGKGRKVVATSRYDAGGNPVGLAAFSGRD